MDASRIRIVGDPALRQVAEEITDIDGGFFDLVNTMFDTMYAAPGIGLAAPQVGVGQRFFVYDLGDDPRVLVNPVITGTDGEWMFDEGCLSVPGQSFEILRPKQIEVTGVDLDGNDVSFEADELLSRLIQHEMDHLNGVLLLDHLEPEVAKAAKRAVREAAMSPDPVAAAAEPSPRRLFGLR